MQSYVSLNGVRHTFTSALFEVTSGASPTFVLLLTSATGEVSWLSGSIDPSPTMVTELATAKYVLEASSVEQLVLDLGSVDLAIAPSTDLQLRAQQLTPSTFYFSGAFDALQLVLEISAHLIDIKRVTSGEA